MLILTCSLYFCRDNSVHNDRPNHRPQCFDAAWDDHNYIKNCSSLERLFSYKDPLFLPPPSWTGTLFLAKSFAKTPSPLVQISRTEHAYTTRCYKFIPQNQWFSLTLVLCIFAMYAPIASIFLCTYPLSCAPSLVHILCAATANEGLSTFCHMFNAYSNRCW